MERSSASGRYDKDILNHREEIEEEPNKEKKEKIMKKKEMKEEKK